jgi:hypothetical protein
MGRSALAVAFLAALAGPLARLLGGAGGVAGLGNEVSLTALGLLGWVALGGLPRAPVRVHRRADEQADERGDASPAGILGLALPGAALGASLDLAAGRSDLEIAWTAALGLILVWLLACAAEQGRGSPWVAGAWWLLVPCLAILPAVARWGRGDAALATGVSPLGWIHARAVGPGPAVRWTDVMPLAVAGGLWALASALPGLQRRPSREPA